MEANILKSVKQVVGVIAEEDAFDLDIMTHINAAFAVLDQLGLDPVFLTTGDETWEGLNLDPRLLAMVRSYLPLKVQLVFDPPATSFAIKAKQDQIDQFEWRITALKSEMEATA